MSVRDQLEETYCSQRQGLFSLALSITGCRQLAEDAIHAAFERLCRLDAESPADDVLTAERDQILRTAVNDLDESDREVVVLKIFAGLTFDAVREILNQPAKTVATRYRRSLIKLEERLRGQL
ncbi:MAG: sigma-70 family RNA polymerase sigma factor [Fuerstiella sp.]|nr:sigma-70 family RNA polymerase sigma factor [Fuerstiella sp.]